MKKKLVMSTLVLAAAAMVTSTVVSAYTKEEVRNRALQTDEVKAQQAVVDFDPTNEGYKAGYELTLQSVEASIEAILQAAGETLETSSSVAASSSVSASSSSAAQENPAAGSVYYGTVIGEYAVHDPRFTSLGLDPQTKAYYEKLDEVASIIEKEMNSQPGAGSSSPDRGSNEYKDGNHRPAYGEEPKSGSVVKASSSTEASANKAASSKKGSKEAKSVEAAVANAKKAAKPAKEGQKVLPNTAAVQ